VLAALLSLGGLGCGATVDDPVTEARQRCTDLRDHVVDLRLKDIADPAVDVAAHRAAMTQALGDHFVDSCLKDLSEKQMNCVLTASDTQSVTDCSSSN